MLRQLSYLHDGLDPPRAEAEACMDRLLESAQMVFDCSHSILAHFDCVNLAD
jgi:hypothetical protein